MAKMHSERRVRGQLPAFVRGPAILRTLPWHLLEKETQPGILIRRLHGHLPDRRNDLHSSNLVPMPRYYFHAKQGQVTVLDHEGVELASNEEAAKEAARRGKDIAAGQVLNDGSPRCVIVADEHERPLFAVPLEDAIKGDGT